MPRLEYSERFADDLAGVTSQKVEKRILVCLDNIERFPEFGSKLLLASVSSRYGDGVRKVFVRPFDLAYTYYPAEDLVRVEALVHAKAAW